MQIIQEPVYYQITRALREYCKQEGLQSGDRFLTERQVSERFGVSRTTANKAISALIADGFLESRRGVGTFYLGRKLSLELSQLVSFTAKAEAVQLNPQTKVHFFCQATEAHKSLFLKQDQLSHQKFIYVERIRFLDDTPVILERRLISCRVLPQLSQVDMENSFYAYLKQQGLYSRIKSTQVLKAAVLEEKEAALLQKKPGFPALLIRAKARMEEKELVWKEHTLYRGDYFEIRNKCSLGGI